MIVDGPIYHTASNETRCRHGHQPRKAGVSVRGSCVRFFSCQKTGCSSYSMGIQNTQLDVTVWYVVSKALFDLLVATDPCTPVLTLLHVAQYHDLAPQDDTEAAA